MNVIRRCGLERPRSCSREPEIPAFGKIHRADRQRGKLRDIILVCASLLFRVAKGSSFLRPRQRQGSPKTATCNDLAGEQRCFLDVMSAGRLSRVVRFSEQDITFLTGKRAVC